MKNLMTNNKQSLEELLNLFKLKKEELKQINSNIEEIHLKMSEMLKTNPKFFAQLSDDEKEQHSVLVKQLRDLKIIECDKREELNQLAIKISELKRSNKE